MRETYTNRPKGNKLFGLILIGQEIKVIRRGMESVEFFTFRHEDMQNKVLYASKRYVHAAVGKPPESCFSIENERIQQQIT